MALPELTLPSGTPGFLAEPHEIEEVGEYADLPMVTGHDRRRRAWLGAPRILNVGLRLNAAQALAFHTWYEGPLKAGAGWFSALVANQGPGLLWWKSRFFFGPGEPAYTAQAKSGGIHLITARLLQVGQGSVDGPYTPDMAAESLIELVGSAEIVLSNALAAESVIALLPAMFLAAESVIALVEARYYDREDSGHIEREDGNKLQRE